MDIHQSIDRILEADEVILGDSFYTVLLGRYPQLQRHFDGINMQRQAVLLTMAMLIIEQFHAAQTPATQRYLRELGAKHREWGIPPETYPFFRAALLEALEGFHGADWNERLAQQWDEAIQSTTRQMLAAYEPA